MATRERKPMKSASMIAAAVGVAFVVGSAGGAYAGHKIHAKDIAKSAVHTKQIADRAVIWKKLNANTQKKIKGLAKQGEQGPQGEPGKDGADGADGVGLATSFDSSAPTTIANIGGPFATRATDVTTFHLDEGQYLITSDAFFDTVDNASAPGTHLQLAVRGQDGSQWGSDDGTCFTGAFPSGDRELTCSTSRLVTIPAGGQDVKVQAFGYNDDGGSTNSGKYTVTAHVAVLNVLSGS